VRCFLVCVIVFTLHCSLSLASIIRSDSCEYSGSFSFDLLSVGLVVSFRFIFTQCVIRVIAFVCPLPICLFLTSQTSQNYPVVLVVKFPLFLSTLLLLRAPQHGDDTRQGVDGECTGGNWWRADRGDMVGGLESDWTSHTSTHWSFFLSQARLARERPQNGRILILILNDLIDRWIQSNSN